jgi:hypothetical protein
LFDFFPPRLIFPHVLVVIAMLIWSITRWEKSRKRLERRLNLTCPKCGISVLDDGGELLLTDGRCPECNTLTFVPDRRDVEAWQPAPPARSLVLWRLFETVPFVACAALLVLGAIVPMSGLVQWIVSVAAFVVLFVGLWYTDDPRRNRAHSNLETGRLPTRHDLGGRIARYRKLGVWPPLTGLVALGAFIYVARAMVRAGVDYPARVGVPFVLAFAVLLLGMWLLWDGWLVAGLRLYCPACGAPLAGESKKFSATLSTLNTWSCHSCGRPVAE